MLDPRRRKNGNAMALEKCCRDTGACVFAAGKISIVDGKRTTGRAAIDQQRVGTRILPCKDERLVRPVEKGLRDIAAGQFQHAGTAIQHILACHALLDLSRRARHTHAARQFRAEGDEAPLPLPAFDQGMDERLSLAVVTDGLAKKTGTDEDLGGHGLFAQVTGDVGTFMQDADDFDRTVHKNVIKD